MKITPQQAAIDRIALLQGKVDNVYVHVNTLLALAINDAVSFEQNLPELQEFKPAILSEKNIIVMTQLKNELNELLQYYSGQKEQFIAAIAVETVIANQLPSKEDAVKNMRQHVEDMARAVVPAAIVNVPTVIHQGVSSIREASALARQAAVAAVATVIEKSGLPTAIALTDRPTPSLVDQIAQPENALQRLLGNASPLLDIFAPSPWLPEGKGIITVGSDGFQWYKRTNPLVREAGERATLPSGFYHGDSRPEFVILRLKNIILVWNFKMTPDDMLFYIVGLSDNNPENVRWFHPSELSASYTRRIVTELAEMIEANAANKSNAI